MLEHLVAPRQPASRLSTIHVPRLTLDMVAECINDGHSVIGLSWACSETGSRVYGADLVPARGGVLVIEGTRRSHVPVMASRVSKAGRVTVHLGCPACPATCTTLYLVAAAPDGEPRILGPRCRRCAALPYGSTRLLFKGAFARQISVAVLDSLFLAAQARAAEGRE